MKTNTIRRTKVSTLRFSEDEDRELRLAARAEGINQSEFIRRAVHDRAELIATPRVLLEQGAGVGRRF